VGVRGLRAGQRSHIEKVARCTREIEGERHALRDVHGRLVAEAPFLNRFLLASGGDTVADVRPCGLIASGASRAAVARAQAVPLGHGVALHFAQVEVGRAAYVLLRLVGGVEDRCAAIDVHDKLVHVLKGLLRPGRAAISVNRAAGIRIAAVMQYNGGNPYSACTINSYSAAAGCWHPLQAVYQLIEPPEYGLP